MSTLSFFRKYSEKEYKGTSFSSNARAKNRADDALLLRSEEKLLRFYVVTNAACDAVSRVVFFFVL